VLWIRKMGGSIELLHFSKLSPEALKYKLIVAGLLAFLMYRLPVAATVARCDASLDGLTVAGTAPVLDRIPFSCSSLVDSCNQQSWQR
jgi:hypothetical protein